MRCARRARVLVDGASRSDSYSRCVPYASVNDVELFYETHGDPSDPAVVLIAGLGVQMIDWPDYFIEPIVASGHLVVQFDNRDIGLSTQFPAGNSDITAVMEAVLEDKDAGVAYTLTDMAADTVGLLDVLGIETFHCIGVSMGGMIAQQIAVSYPERVLTLTSIMSTVGPEVGAPTAEAVEGITKPVTTEVRKERIEQGIATARIWASPDHYDEDRLRRMFERSWDRIGGDQSKNGARQLCAIIASPSRADALAKLTVPTLVVHGTSDPLITPAGGDRTAEVVPHARLLKIDGMGHDLVPAFVPTILAAITELVASSQAG